jgi:hypothetical protein
VGNNEVIELGVCAACCVGVGEKESLFLVKSQIEYACKDQLSSDSKAAAVAFGYQLPFYAWISVCFIL